MNSGNSTLSEVLNRNLVFVHGKGGVGKTSVSFAIANGLAQKKSKTLWITVQDPVRPLGELTALSPFLWHLNCEFTQSFEEYASMKIGAAKLTRLFLQNKVMRYLAKAAPGIHDLVLLGKIWFERNNYDHVVVDLPSTGYGLAMFQSTENFAKLFRGGPLHRDAEAMLQTFKNTQTTGHVILALPEEMPLREGIELNAYLSQIVPGNPAAFLVNRTFPEVRDQENHPSIHPDEWLKPFADSAKDYAYKRFRLENHNMRIWKDEKIDFGLLEFIPPPLTDSFHFITKKITEQLQSKAYL